MSYADHSAPGGVIFSERMPGDRRVVVRSTITGRLIGFGVEESRTIQSGHVGRITVRLDSGARAMVEPGWVQAAPLLEGNVIEGPWVRP